MSVKDKQKLEVKPYIILCNPIGNSSVLLGNTCGVSIAQLNGVDELLYELYTTYNKQCKSTLNKISAIPYIILATMYLYEQNSISMLYVQRAIPDTSIISIHRWTPIMSLPLDALLKPSSHSHTYC